MKTRFAPSPTGLLHLGNVRTALFNYLLAQHYQGTFLLRLEDTDATRGEEHFEQALQSDLQWLGLGWDEGPDRDGGNGPYWQSERGDIYRRYFDRLRELGLAYPCFCSEHELKLSRKAQLAASQAPRYSGRCHGLGQAEVTERFTAGNPATLRFHVDDTAVIEFTDKVRGSQRFLGSDIGDFIIRRSDGTSAFFFSNAVDDALMGVSLVVRGEDHLTNTPRQMMILQALGLPVPEYAHIALVVGHDGAPLSKRHGSKMIEELRDTGYLSIAIINYLARLGHSYDENGFMTLDQLAAKFDSGRLHKAPARFDEIQLRYWQKEAILQLSDETLWAWLQQHQFEESRQLTDLVPAEAELAFVQTIRDNITLPADALQWAGSLYASSGQFESHAGEVLRTAGASFFTAALVYQEETGDDFRAFAQALRAATGKKGKELYLPMRAALTAEIADSLPAAPWQQGPELVRVWQLLGHERIRRRLQLAQEVCKA